MARTQGMRRRLARFCKSLDFRLEELIETLGPQTGFQFLVIGPEPGVEVQGQGDERGVFQVHTVAKAAGLHPDADRNTRGLHKLERFEEFIEGFEELVFGQTRRGEQAVAVFEKFHEEKTRGEEDRASWCEVFV